MMNEDELARLIAKGLIETGVEGGYDNVCCSTAYDSLCLGVSSWEQERGQALLAMISGADKFISRPYSDLSDEEIEELSALLDSEQGHIAQLNLLANDCLDYVFAVIDAGLNSDASIIYAGMWCPTSTYVVCRAIAMAKEEGVDVDDVDSLADYFHDNYAIIADCEEYEEGYQNRSNASVSYIHSVVG